MDYKQEYEKKLGTLQDAYQLVNSGDTIVLAGDCNCPKAFAGELHTQADRLENVTVFKDHSNPADFARLEGMAGHINSVGFFYGKDLIEGMQHRNSSFFPTDLCNYASFLNQERDMTLFVAAAAPMNEEGYFQVGLCNMWEGDCLDYALQNHCKIIIEENPNLPWVSGGAVVPVSAVTCVVKVDYPMGTIPAAKPTEEEVKVAQNVRSLLKDGDCVQFGIGSLPDAIASQCMDLQDLGLHTEMITTALGEMIRKGVITGMRKNFHHGEHLFTFAGGDEALYQTLGEDRQCVNVRGSYGVNPMVICKNDNMVSVNTLIEMDLTGQVCSESIGPRQHSGSGGGFDFAYGAMMSKGGREIMAFTSKTKKGYSKIRPLLAQGAVVTVPRNYVDYIVTEYGIAQMRGRSVRERAQALIGIAHPDFRGELRKEAEKLLYF